MAVTQKPKISRGDEVTLVTNHKAVATVVVAQVKGGHAQFVDDDGQTRTCSGEFMYEGKLFAPKWR